MSHAPPEAPDKVIWMFWDKGYAAAPILVQLCIDSWRAQNPTWTVVLLDEQSVTRYVDLTQVVGPHCRTLPIQKLSVLLRLTLLARFGGVWADSTLYCAKPLDAWLPQYLGAGFFAFRDPGPDRSLSNWFLAAHKGNYLAAQFQRVTVAYFRDHRFPPQNTALRRFVMRRLTPRLNVNTRTTRGWFSWPVRRVLRVYPYFVNHYLFNKLLEDDPTAQAMWSSGTPLARASSALIRQASGEREGLARVAADLEAAATPMYKLDWRVDPYAAFWAAVLPMLRQHMSAGRTAP